jgi:hypothetical protein
MRSLCVRWVIMGAASLGMVARLPAQSIPLAVNHGHCEFVVATPHVSDQFYLVVGSLAGASRITDVRVKSERTDGPESLPLETPAPDASWKNRVEAQAHWLERLRRVRPVHDRFPPLALPPAGKTFHLFTGDRDLDDPANYQAVAATLAAVGRNAQVYLDKDDRHLPGIDETVAAVLKVFDEEVYPWAETHLGHALDVDRDGRFTIFLTSRLGSLQNGKSRVDGFVRGSDFCRDMPAPFSNHCDMLYLNAALKPGPQLRTVLAHEFTHAVIFCEHSLAGYDGSRSHDDEESWLNEGLSHLVESLHEYGWSNLDYRIGAFLACPERYPLVVPDYFAAGLWREPGTRGAAFLFMRSCLEQADAALPKRLIQSPLRGITNLEAATQKPFAPLFRQATVDVLDRRNYGYLDSEQKGPLLRGPRVHEVALANGHGECKVAGTAAAYFHLHSPSGGYARIAVEAAEPVQVTLVRVSRDNVERRAGERDAKPQAAIVPK